MSESNIPSIHEDDDEELLEGCGYSWDHDENITYEDEELIQWLCRECGAEGESEK